MMNAVELEKELWEINNQLTKAGIKPSEYPTMADAVAELRGRYNKYKALFDEVVADRDRLLNEQATQLDARPVEQSAQSTSGESTDLQADSNSEEFPTLWSLIRPPTIG